jgi:hypothetical protein
VCMCFAFAFTSWSATAGRGKMLRVSEYQSLLIMSCCCPCREDVLYVTEMPGMGGSSSGGGAH